MRAIRLPNGNLIVPVRVESEDGLTVGDGHEEIGPDHPDYAEWLRFARERERPFPVEHVRAAAQDQDVVDEGNEIATFIPTERFDQAESVAEHLGASMDDLDWVYFRSPPLTWEHLAGTEGWLLWNSETGEQYGYIEWAIS